MAIMAQTLGCVALVVREYDEAIAFFTRLLGFQVVEDSAATNRLDRDKLGTGCSAGSSGTKLLLARASTPEETNRIGNQTGGRVFLFLHTDDFWRDYHAMSARGVKFLEAPRVEVYGTVALFEDLYGNKWDLLQLRADS
jgi:catechol 2,3-dioxygenase-like lactoylglutathione lyase family enzyme